MASENGKLSIAFLYDDSLDRADGVTQQVRRLGEWMVANGHKVSYLVGDTRLDSWAGGKVYSLSRNVRVVFNGNRLSIPLVSKKRRIKQALAEAQPDVIHVQAPYSPLMAARVINAAAKNTAIVGTFHILPSGSLSRFGNYLLRLALWRTLRRVNQMTATSPAAAEFARQAYGLNSSVIPNAVDSAAFKSGSGTKPDSNKIVFLGRLVERKGCRQLIQAFAALSKNQSEARLVVAGDGPQRSSLESLASSLGVGDKVSFLGFIDEAQKPELLASAGVACFPSISGESFGIVLIEAMAAGAGVVIGGDNPGYRSVLAEHPGQLVDPNDIDRLAATIKGFLADGTKAAAAHQWQAETVKQYDVSVIGKRFLSVYLEAIAKRTKAKA